MVMSQIGDAQKHLGCGLYDLNEAAHLISRDPQTLARWALGPNGLLPAGSKSLSFLDLISLRVIAELRDRSVSLADIRRASSYLSDVLSTRHPFAHERLATAGTAFFAELETWVDAGKRGQLAFDEIVEPALRRIEFGEMGLAERWRPSAGVLIDPTIQAGAPCVDGTRVTTTLVAGLADDGYYVDEIASEYDLEEAQVEQALEFESVLISAA